MHEIYINTYLYMCIYIYIMYTLTAFTLHINLHIESYKEIHIHPENQTWFARRNRYPISLIDSHPRWPWMHKTL